MKCDVVLMHVADLDNRWLDHKTRSNDCGCAAMVHGAGAFSLRYNCCCSGGLYGYRPSQSVVNNTGLSKDHASSRDTKA